MNPNNLDAFLLLANVQKAHGSIDAALATAYQLMNQNPTNAGAYYLAGTLEDSRANWQKAEALYQRAIQLQSDFPLAANNLAYGMLAHGEDTDVALSLAQQARQKMPDSPSIADTLAWIYYHKGLYGMAADLLQEALQKAPDNATYHYHLGMVSAKQNKTEVARRHLQRALKLNPTSPDAQEIRKALRDVS